MVTITIHQRCNSAALAAITIAASSRVASAVISLRLWEVAKGVDKMAESVSGPRYLCGHVPAIVGVYGRLESHPADDLNSGFRETIELCRVVRE
jgi:hypothetical protein